MHIFTEIIDPNHLIIKLINTVCVEKDLFNDLYNLIVLPDKFTLIKNFSH